MRTSNDTGAARTILAAAALAAALPLLAACDLDGRAGGLEAEPIEIGPEQELAMCERLFGNSSTGSLPKTAGAALGEGGAIDASAGKKTVTLTDFEGHKGGFIRLSINHEIRTPVFLMLLQDVPFAAVRDDGAQVSYEDAGDPVCQDAKGRFLWVVEDSTNHLRFGPTSAAQVDLVIEVVE